MNNPPKLLDRMADVLRTRHYSERTREAYVAWARRFILFHGKRHPSSMGADEVNAYLTALATRDHVSAATQNQALCAILFLYRHVLGDPLPWIDGVVRAQRPARLPVVLTRDEVDQVLARVQGLSGVVARLLYGSGLRLLEALRLRVKDIDFARRQLLIRDPKGRRDRATMLPKALTDRIVEQLAAAHAIHDEDLRLGFGEVWLPDALARKLPNAAREWTWQWVFPATTRWRDAATAVERRHHLHESAVQRAVRRAAIEAGMTKRVTCHTFRHSFATHLLVSWEDSPRYWPRLLLQHSHGKVSECRSTAAGCGGVEYRVGLSRLAAARCA